MRQGDPGHLTPEQAFAMGSGRTPEADSRRHVEECADCRRQVTEWELWLKKLNSGQDDGNGTSAVSVGLCLTPAELTALADGGAEGVRDGALEHLSECPRCSEMLREALLSEELSGEERDFAAGMRTSSAEWQRRAAAELTTLRMPARKPLPRWLAAAAVFVVCAGAAAWWGIRELQPARLLARAYTDSRPFDYRLPDIGHADVAPQVRGTSSQADRPIALSLADAWIHHRLASGASDAQDQFLAGRLRLIEGDYDGAVDSFTNGLAKTNPPDAGAEGELGCAYALRAEKENRNSDYGKAINVLADSLRLDPSQPQTWFNAALVYEHAQFADQAIEAWRKYLELDPAGEWAPEANTHLKKLLDEQEKHKKDQGRVTADPRRFLALLSEERQAVEPELYLDTFWAKWLPEVRTDADTRRAAEELGRIVTAGFHDDSVTDAVHQTLQTDAGADLKQLADVLTGSVQERNDAALAQGQKLVESLGAHGQTVARIRAAHELSYNYNRAGMNDACLQLEKEQLHRLENTSYRWLRGLVGIQHATCAGWGFDVSAARAEAMNVRAQAQDDGFHYLALKARVLLVSIDQVSGDFAQVWKNAPDVLAEYWNSGASDFRAQVLIHDLRVSATALNMKETAVVLERATVLAAMRATALSKNRILEALNRGDLAAVLAEAGYHDQAIQELDHARNMLNAAEPGPTLQIAKKQLALQWAEMQAHGPQAAAALATLDEIANWPESAGIVDRLRIYQARGLAQRATGDNAGAEASFREAIRLHRMHLAKSPVAQRLTGSAIARESYRNLTELQLSQDRDTAGALRTWESYRDLLDGQPSADSALSLKGPAALIYAALPSGVAVWVRSRTGLHGEIIQGSQDEMRIESESLMSLVSSPPSSVDQARAVASLKAAAGKLYAQFIGPFEADLATADTVCIEADEWLASVPFGLLVDRNGNYLASRHPVAAITSLRDTNEAGGAYRFTAADRALIVSAPAPIAPSGEHLPLLRAAREETLFLRQRMPAAVLLEDANASNEALTREIPRATLFHFAGHGWANGGNGGLLLEARYNDVGSRQPAPSWIGADQLAAQDWKRCRLAVLSASLTATGEEHGPVNNQSLVRALLAGGAQRVVAARWSVDSDATRVLMEKFYDALFAGESPARALATAEVSVSAVRGWGHPYYWAGFDVFGRQ